MSRANPLGTSPAPGRQFATLAGGCFWCLEAVYEELAGVTAVESGYANGNVKNPSYREVCGGDTGHAEVVRIEFDPSVTSFRELLEVFFVIHDPTTLNRQGADAGTQYRSGIYVHDADQERIARDVIAEAQAHYRSPIVTEVAPVANYSRAEEHHQEYFANNPHQGYCAMVVAPKVAKFRKHFTERLKRKP